MKDALNETRQGAKSDEKMMREREGEERGEQYTRCFFILFFSIFYFSVFSRTRDNVGFVR